MLISKGTPAQGVASHTTPTAPIPAMDQNQPPQMDGVSSSLQKTSKNTSQSMLLSPDSSSMKNMHRISFEALANRHVHTCLLSETSLVLKCHSLNRHSPWIWIIMDEDGGTYEIQVTLCENCYLYVKPPLYKCLESGTKIRFTPNSKMIQTSP